MTQAYVIGLGHHFMSTAFWTVLPVIAFGMAVGLAVAVFQAATQIQETSLTFVPKVLGMGAALFLYGPWILEKLTSFTKTLILSIATVGGG